MVTKVLYHLDMNLLLPIFGSFSSGSFYPLRQGCRLVVRELGLLTFYLLRVEVDFLLICFLTLALSTPSTFLVLWSGFSLGIESWRGDGLALTRTLRQELNSRVVSSHVKI